MIKDLSKAGYKIKVKHYRNISHFGDELPQKGPTAYTSYRYIRGCGFVDLPKKIKPHQFGGITQVEITHPDKAVLIKAQANCSYSDRFNYRTGKNIALGRAIDKLIKEGHWQ